MKNYFRITAYHPEEDISVILDSNGKFEMLWQFSAYLVSKKFKIIEVSTIENIIESTFPQVDENKEEILIRSVNRGMPEIQEMTYEGRPCKAITVYDKLYGQYTN